MARDCDFMAEIGCFHLIFTPDSARNRKNAVKSDSSSRGNLLKNARSRARPCANPAKPHEGVAFTLAHRPRASLAHCARHPPATRVRSSPFGPGAQPARSRSRHPLVRPPAVGAPWEVGGPPVGRVANPRVSADGVKRPSMKPRTVKRARPLKFGLHVTSRRGFWGAANSPIRHSQALTPVNTSDEAPCLARSRVARPISACEARASSPARPSPIISKIGCRLAVLTIEGFK